MKKLFLLALLTIALSCNKDSQASNNPYLPNYPFSIVINMNLPSYSQLQYPGNPVYVNQAGAGIKGLIVMKVGTNDYRAFEASCPNQFPSDCSRLMIDGINAVCPCDDKEYSLYTGLGNGQYPLKPYRIDVGVDVLRVYN